MGQVYLSTSTLPSKAETQKVVTTLVLLRMVAFLGQEYIRLSPGRYTETIKLGYG